MLSKWHVHALDYAREANRHPQIEIVMVWDEAVRRGRDWAQELDVPFEADLRTVLSDPAVDAVIVDAPTTRHSEVIIAAAEHRKHIFSEKVLALTVKECDAIFEAVKRNNVKLMLSLPRLTDPRYLYAQQARNQGLLGRLTLVRCRVAHDGAVPREEHPQGWLPERFFNPAETGGGALIDLGAHPIYLTNRLAGPAKAVTARLTSFTNRQVDDNAVVMVECESGALGIIETAFVASRNPFLLELHGTDGTLLIEDGNVRLRSRHLDEGDWVTPPLPSPLLSPMAQWVAMIKENEAPSITEEDMRYLTLINEAAARSHREGCRVSLGGWPTSSLSFS
jgi:predicted dehydrogenase